jgi:hypothetical protein
MKPKEYIFPFVTINSPIAFMSQSFNPPIPVKEMAISGFTSCGGWGLKSICKKGASMARETKEKITDSRLKITYRTVFRCCDLR